MKTWSQRQNTGQTRPENGQSAAPCPHLGPGWYRSAHSGFTLVEIMIVVAILGVLSAIAVPNYIRARSSTQVKACITNLQKLYGAKAQWAMENKKADSDIPWTTDIAPYLNSGSMPICPANGSYRLRRVSRYPSCTLYSIGHTMYNVNMDDDPLAD